MKWLFIVLLAGNLVYFGLEYNSQVTIDLANARQALKIPAGTPDLQLVNEIATPPLSRQGASTRQVHHDNEDHGGMDPGIQQTDVKIEETFVNQLLTQLPDISFAGVADGLTPASKMCFTFGPFPDDSQTSELVNWFVDRSVKYEQRLESEKEKQLFWIYLQAQDSRTSAIQAIEDLKNKGVKDYRLIESGDMQNAISLGLFSTQASVNKRLNELKDKGYHPVVIPYRDAQAIYWVDVLLAGQQDILNQMFTGLPARFNSIPVDCTEIALR